MKKLILMACLCVASFSLIQAQTTYFVKFDGIDGESTDKNHGSWSDVLSFSQGMAKPSGGLIGQSRRRGAVQFNDLEITKTLDKASVKIQEAISKGQVYPSVLIDVVDNSNIIYQYELKNVMVTSYTISSGQGVEILQESFSLNFEELKVTYSEFDSSGKKKGSVEYQWRKEDGR